ncbi:MAG: serine hydrolase [Notoacmeibacter sp.]|nr:serine hydrolase [Notoacmeibacter sp.]
MAFSILVAFTSQAACGALDDRLNAAYTAGELPGLHGVIVQLNEQRLAEDYWPGDDQRWGDPLGTVEHGPDTLHDLRSVTKSVVGLLYGIALAEGKVPAPDTPLYRAFPEYPDLAADPKRKAILVGHALSMQMGLQWNEDLPYTDPGNSEIAMERAPDRYRFALEQPVLDAPGTRWTYSGGAVALLARLIEKGVGMDVDAYAQEVLFKPLGIANHEWVSGSDGVPSAASGLRLTLPDLTRIGRLVANNGRWEGRQVVPAGWLEQSFRPRSTINEQTRYGYLWYLAAIPGRTVAIAVGNGGQRLTVQPDAGLVVSSFAGRYNDADSWQTSLKVLLDFAIPEARRLLGR